MEHKSKRNSRLESFLKRSLPSKIFHKIRVYEGVIIRGAGETLGFRWGVLTDTDLYLTENPPKSIKRSLRFSSIINISVVHDYPDFLRGPEREQCQHICLTVRNFGSIPRTRRRYMKHVKQGNDNDGHQSIRRSSSQDDENGLPEESCSDAVSVFSEADENGVEDGQRRPTHLSLRSRETWDSSDISPTNSLKPSTSLQVLKTESPETEDARSDSPPESDLRRSKSALETTAWRSSSQVDLPSRSKSQMDQHGNNRVLAQRSHSITLGEEDDEKMRSKSSELHIYILNESSTFLMWLQTSWTAALINRTLELELLKEECGNLRNSPTAHPEQLSRLYEQLAGELHTASPTPTSLTPLLQELLAGAQKMPDIKTLFWKDRSLYGHTVKLLRLFLHESHVTRNPLIDREEALRGREEELETAALLVDILHTMLTETGNLQAKLQFLLSSGGETWRTLLRLLLSIPDVPTQFSSTTHRMLSSFSEFVSRAWDNLPEAELIKLLAEVNNTSTSAIYELLVTLEQSAGSHFSPDLAQALGVCRVEQYISRAVPQLLAFLFTGRTEKLSGSEVVLVYHHLHVLHTMVQHRPSLQTYLRQHFTEEFRYYVHPKLVLHKIPEYYPIRTKVLVYVQRLTRLTSGSATTRNGYRHR